MKKRCGWLDVMKLLGIYFVYVVHYEETGRLGLFFMSIALGVLFFASGFSASAREDMPLWPFVKEKLCRLMVPYFAFGALTLCMRVAVFELTLGEIIDWVRRLLLGVRNSVPISALWFLPCLFCMAVYYHVLCRLVKNRWLLLAVCFAISTAVKLVHEGPFLPWGAELAGRFLIYYALGDFAHACTQGKSLAELSMPVKMGLGAFVLANVYVLYTHFYFGQMYFPGLVGVEELSFPATALVQFLYQCNGIVCVWAASLLMQALPGLCRAGRCTLMFCCTEQLVKILTPMVFQVCGLTMFDTGGPYVLIHAALLLVIAYYVFALPAQRYFPWALGRFSRREQT